MLVLITGALGQDGIILSKILLKKKIKVYGIIKKGFYPYKVKNVKYLKIDLDNKTKIQRILCKIKPDYLIHFGSENPSFSERNKKKYIFEKKNTENSLNLINSIIKNKLKTVFLFANSSQIFADNIKIANEKSVLRKKDFYTSFRVNIFNYLKFLKFSKNFKFVNLILFNHDSKFRNQKFLFPKIVNAVKKNDYEFLQYIYNQNIVGDFSHAEDICNAIYLIIKNNVIVDNMVLSSNKKVSINKIIDYLIKKKMKKIFLKKNKIKKKNFNLIGKNAFARKKLNWKIKKNIFNAVEEM